MSHAFQSTATGGRTYQVSKLPELDYTIDVKIFRDILELDDEDEQYFTRSLVCDFFALAQRTFAEMDACLNYGAKPNFSEVRVRTLGIYKVEPTCARIEQVTAVADTFQAEGNSRTTLCNSSKILLGQAKQYFAEAEAALRRFYGMD
ncbi:hypothetical protein KCU65_g9928, partial [Aureobasidium melanogenum]